VGEVDHVTVYRRVLLRTLLTDTAPAMPPRLW
jgi:hypothetical protein